MKKVLVFSGGAYPFITAGDKEFERSCKLEFYIASGPGGQKRNRTYSAVRATHNKTNISTIAEESRSQTDNKEKALKRLKKKIALHVRKDFSATGFKVHPEAAELFLREGIKKINSKNSLYPLYCAVLLDSIYTAKGKLSEASERLNSSTGKMNKVISSDRDIFNAVNRLRSSFGLNSLRFS